ncbi:methylated-DNA--[protein]-cysteine S-methyltransferase [Agaribacter marinus]|uniref:methylated-DNA--[protein]-cysteine S-methyltransferase n=1 Tax=Agaribacter marinus TaxID=1431249 RepID=UPI0024E1327F|nr:methylated-DNA--[protein]-cysteine S-methyltransferase [Agaribacter marinus]
MIKQLPEGHFVSQLQTDIGYLRLYANDSAITEIRFFEDAIDEIENSVTRDAKAQLTAYFEKKLKTFDLPLAPKGTDFQKSVWAQLLTVPHGEVVSYLDIANQLGKPTACRAVGAANGKNPISIVIPCHRIIGSSGKLTGYAGGLPRKSFLLTLEGADFYTEKQYNIAL